MAAPFFDFDNDGWLDIFLLSGTRLADASGGTSNRLFKNNRDGTFTDVTERAGLLKTGWACGVCVGDYNNDGFEDLFVTYWGQNVLYRNNGDGTFTDVTQATGLVQAANRYRARGDKQQVQEVPAIQRQLVHLFLSHDLGRPRNYRYRARRRWR